MAAIGFAVGLGNIWRFPYLTGENGGGAFVLVYLLCVALIGVPILMAELLIGRRGRGSPPTSLARLAAADGASSRWRALGSVNVLTAFLIQVVYAVVAGWVLRYFYLAVSHGFSDATVNSALASFSAMRANTLGALGWTFLGLGLTGLILVSGVQRGIERAVRVLMPILFMLLVSLAVYNVFAGGFVQALTYLFSPDFSQIDGSLLLAAVGQAFFSIGVAMAGMMTFGAYLPKDVSITRSAFIIVLGDTLVALVAGLVIFPAVFNNGLNPAEGTGLIFQTLPLAFSQMPGGYVVGALFFLLLSVAAITSMVGLVEPLIAWLRERFDVSRMVAVAVALCALALCSVISVLSFSTWSEFTIGGMSLSALMDFVPNQILLPLGGLLIAVFAGWQMSKEATTQELGMSMGFGLWRTLVRFPVPIAILVIFVAGLN